MEATLKYLILIFFISIFSSCAKNKYFFKNNKFNTFRDSPRPAPDSNGITPDEAPDTLISFTLKKGIKGKLKELDGYVTIDPKTITNVKLKDSVIKLMQAPPGNEVVYNSKVDLFKNTIFIPDVISPGADQNIVIKFFDSKPVLQTLSTPIKIRPALKDPALKDSFPSQVSTGVNLGMAFGWKFSFNYYRPKPNVFGLKISQISFTPGVFYGLGATNLTKANTRNPIVVIDRSALSHNIGGFAMFGFNNINIGYSTGWDFVTGPNKSAWLYQGRIWHGVALSLDLIK